METVAGAPRFFEEIAIGDRFESPEITVSEAEIVEFARRYDPQPMHVDPEAARAGFFGGLVASGWHTGSLTMRMIVESRLLGGHPVVGLGVEELRWLRPVRPGDRLRARCEICGRRESRSQPDRGLLRVRIETVDAQDRPVMVMVSTIVAPRRQP